MSSSWITTCSGRQFFIDEPRARDVAIGDIAHALSQICRFVGHTRTHYSVAQHSVEVCKLVHQWCPENKALQFAALMHDSAEAYLTDVPRPVKQLTLGYRALEEQMLEAIAEKLGFDARLVHSPQVKAADNDLMLTEVRDLMSPGANRGQWTALFPDAQPLRRALRALSAKAAKEQFLRYFGIYAESP